MSLTVSRLTNPIVPGSEVYTRTEVTFDSSYLEGGESFTAADAGLKSISWSHCEIINGSEEGTVRPGSCYHKEEKLHLIDNATGKEVASTKNMEKVKVRVHAFGTLA